MSRLATMSAAAVEALFAAESNDTLVLLVRIYDPDTGEVIARIADNYTQRITDLTTDLDLVYGIVSNGNEYIFLPVEITLPSESQDGSSKFSLTINDVTQHLTPLIRTISGPPQVELDIVLKSQPNIVEAQFKDFFVSSISYNSNTVSCEMSMINYQVEPFPVYSFTPKYFRGLF